MSLLGRLEDLSLTDIIQIVFLSRRTGILEIIDSRGRYTVLFRHGLLANASSPESPDLAAHLSSTGAISDKALTLIRSAEQEGVSAGSSVLEMKLLTTDDLAQLIQQRIADIIGPLLASRDGEFNFILSEQIGPIDVEYDADAVFKEGGIPPSRILGGEGEKIKPLRDLEESMKAGRSLRRAAAPANESGGVLDLNMPSFDAIVAPSMEPVGTDDPPVPDVASLAELEAPQTSVDAPPSEAAMQPAADEENLVPFPSRGDAPLELDFDDIGEIEEDLESLLPLRADDLRDAILGDPSELDTPPKPRFRVSGGADQGLDANRSVVLFETDPLVRVSARRAFQPRGIRLFQFGSLEDTRASVRELLAANQFFVTFLELSDADRTGESESIRLLHAIKKKNRHLPVVAVDDHADLRMRHRMLKEGADLYLTKPSKAHLRPEIARQELATFADELVLCAENFFAGWVQLTGTFDRDADAGIQFYEIARKEKVTRSFDLLRHLINELSSPDDISQVSTTILHLAEEYLDRAVVFIVEPKAFVGIAGFGITGEGESLVVRARRISIPRWEPSVLVDAIESRRSHQGKLHRTDANIQLIRDLGRAAPSEIFAAPLLYGDEPVGVLFGDNAENRNPIDDMTGLEIFLSQAGFAFGNAVLARRRHREEP